MPKKKRASTASPARGPIARKVIAEAKMHLQKKVTSLSEWRAGIQNADDLQKSAISADQLAKYDPLHGIYTYGQNQLSVLIEHIVNLPAARKLADVYAEACDNYTPSYPPMSPITDSFFTCWGSFDLRSNGAKKETLASIAIDVCKALSVDDQLITLYETMQASRMGIYVLENVSGNYLFFRELITGEQVKAISTSGYMGRPGEVWYVRILPPVKNLPNIDYSVIFTTPYVLGKGFRTKSFVPVEEQDWLNYFDRRLGNVRGVSQVIAYEEFMKHGPNRTYWCEYIFLAYRNHQPGVIYLDGVPDMPASLPFNELAKDSINI